MLLISQQLYISNTNNNVATVMSHRFMLLLC